MNLSEGIALANEGKITAETFRTMPRAELLRLAEEAFRLKDTLRRENQIEYYVPASDRARAVHYSTAKEVVAVGGNRSSKTTTTLADLVIAMTGLVPHALPNYPKEKIRCPGAYRIVCESLTNTWAPVIRKKLQWDKWNGRGDPGGPFGHWGLIPRRFLKKGKWEESWSEKERILTLTCGCTLQICSYDQDEQDQSGSALHRVVFDEGPPRDMYRENKMRTIDTGGQLMIAFTPPDDETTSWKAAWIFDQLYEKGMPGPSKDLNIDTFELWTEENRILDQADVDMVFKGLTPAQKETRGKGAFMHLGGRIYPVYTDRARHWCFQCNELTFAKDDKCAACGERVVEICHFCEPFDAAYTYPCVFMLDPHPRKPYTMAWYAIDAVDDWWQVGELLVDDKTGNLDFLVELKKQIDDFETRHGLTVYARQMDPKMAGQAAHNAGRRQVTVRDKLDQVGIRCALADSNFDAGMIMLRDRLKPDNRTRRPRFHIFNTCPVSNRQFLKYTWKEHVTARAAEVNDQKAVPIDKNDDLPTLARYLGAMNPSYAGLQMGASRFRPRGERMRRKAANG